jgi:hypothetical protein
MQTVGHRHVTKDGGQANSPGQLHIGYSLCTTNIIITSDDCGKRVIHKQVIHQNQPTRLLKQFISSSSLTT